jgi:hypothetical protein
MKGAFAIAAAEIRQHRLVLWAALVCGLMPLLLLIPSVNRTLPQFSSPGEAHPGVATAVWFLAVVLSIAVAAGLGMDAFAGDLRDRRLGFWLSRPLPLVQYWAGKLGAAWLLSVAAAVIVMLPGHLLGALGWSETVVSLHKALGWRGWLAGLAFAVAAGSALSGVIRARSALVVLDIAMVPIVAAAWWSALGSNHQAGTLAVLIEYGFKWLLAMTCAVLLAAGAAQVCVGRLDLRRGHALLSAIAWGGMLVLGSGGMLAFSRYVRSETPADLRLFLVRAPGSGGQVLLEGWSRRWKYHDSSFLVDEQGRSVRVDSGLMAFAYVWSRDGRTLAGSRAGLGPQELPVFLRGFGFEPALTVLQVDLPTPRIHSLPIPRDALVYAVSPRGRRLLMDRRNVWIADAETGQAIATLDDPHEWTRASFVSEDTVRAVRRVQPPASSRVDAGDAGAPVGLRTTRATVVDWNLESGHVTDRGSIDLRGGWSPRAGLTPSEDWQSVLRVDESGLYLHGLDGRVIATLVDGWQSRMNRAAGPLSGGRYGCIEEQPSGLYLRVFASDGRLLSEARLRGRSPLRVGGEPAAGVLAIEVAPFFGEGERATLLVDLATGATVRREPGLSPAIRRWEPGSDLESTHVDPGSFGARLFFGDDGLVSLDPATGAKTVVVASRNRLAEN